MQDNLQESPFIIFVKKIWPFIYRVINGIVYFILSVIRSMFRIAIEMIKGG